MGQNEECPPPSSPTIVVNNGSDNSAAVDMQNDCVAAESETNCLEPFVHQVGGHGSVLTWDERTVCKPYSSRERQFYEILPCEFEKFVPEFKGVIEVGLIEDSSGYLTLNAYKSKLKTHRKIHESASSSALCSTRSSMRIKLKRSGSLELETNGDATADVAFTDECSGSSSAYKQNPWAKECQTRHLSKMQRKKEEKQQFLMLQNLVSSYNLPCILDLKMGVRQYGDDASEAKRKAQTEKCEGSTSSVLGVRLCGMQVNKLSVYHKKSGMFRCHNKYYGRTLTVDGFKKEMEHFWNNGVKFRTDLLTPCLAKLKALREVLSKADGYRFYSSSLLIIYDGDDDENRLTSSPSVDVRMIDFEHSTCPGFRNDPSHENVDKGYIMGLNSLIDILTEFNTNSDSSPTSQIISSDDVPSIIVSNDEKEELIVADSEL